MSPQRKEKKKKISCKKCGRVINPTETPPDKTWQLISPMPDKEGRVTLTIMGSFRCPDCNASVRAAMKKIKGDDLGEGFSKNKALTQALSMITEPTPLEQIEIEGIRPAAVSKAIEILINQGKLAMRIEGDTLHPK